LSQVIAASQRDTSRQAPNETNLPDEFRSTALHLGERMSDYHPSSQALDYRGGENLQAKNR
jgi:hypothetical protein